MTAASNWEQSNNAFLSEAIEWLRTRLERRANELRPIIDQPSGADGGAGNPMLGESQTEPTKPDAAAKSKLAKRSTKSEADLASDDHAVDTDIEHVPLDVHMDPPPALVLLGRRLGLTAFEQDVLLLCVAMDLDTRVAALCAQAQDDQHRPYPTYALALSLFDEPAWDVVSPDRPLRYWKLLEIHQHSGQPLTVSQLRADERIVNYVKGLNYLDDRLTTLLAPIEVEADAQVELPLSQQQAVDEITRHLGAQPRHLPIVQLLGGHSPSLQLVAVHAAARLSLQLYRMPGELLPTQHNEIETLSRLWQRETQLLPISLYLDTHNIEAASDGHSQSVRRFLIHSQGVLFLGTRELWSNLGKPQIVVDVSKPTPSEQRAMWETALGEVAGQNPAALAGQFNLDVSTIQQVTRTVLHEKPNESSLGARLWDACRVAVRPRLDVLAQRIDAKATWDDLVLPKTQVDLLHQIGRQVIARTKVYGEYGFAERMNRGLGITALFAGDSGTGKTMAAEVIANDLRLNLYRIDLSAVVNKYIGETEKNLRRLFDAAEDGGAILFFDEADALFGKRTETKDSHDLYANIQINYLLQRMESYRGLAILATNMKSAMDTAFMRRMRFIVNFSFPGAAERKRMWEQVFPQDTPIGEIDFDRLARLNLTGSSIHTVALNAAFFAAQEGTSVSMPLILAAARTEFAKLDRPINESEFRWQDKAEVA
jgi:hypothetical protein